MRFLCQVSSTGSFLRFHRRLLCSIALNHPVALHRPAARAGRAPYRFRSRVTRDPTDAATGGLVLRSFSEGGCPPMTVSLCCRLFLSHFSSAVGDRLRIV